MRSHDDLKTAGVDSTDSLDSLTNAMLVAIPAWNLQSRREIRINMSDDVERQKSHSSSSSELFFYAKSTAQVAVLKEKPWMFLYGTPTVRGYGKFGPWTETTTK